MPLPNVPPPPLPPELTRWTVRTPTADDVERVFALTADVERHVIGTAIITRAEVERNLGSASAREASATVLVEHDGDAAALAWVEQVHEDHFGADVQIHPRVHVTDGDRITAWALGWIERLVAAVEPRPPRVQLGNWSFENDTDRNRRLRAHGYEPVRTFLRMTRDLPAGEVFPEPSADVTVRPAQVRAGDPEHGDAQLVHQLITTSFADHFNFTASPFEQWFARRTDDAGFDPELWWIAELDGVPLGAMIMNDSLADNGAGYVHYIGVLRDGRGRGVAKALLYKGFEVNQERGRSTVKLFVDAESPTGATALYESVGMTRELATLDWQKWLTVDQ